MTYTSSEDAMEADESISFECARAELRRHGMECRRPSEDEQPRLQAFDATHIQVWAEEYSEGQPPVGRWETIPRTTKAILEWLGY